MSRTRLPERRLGITIKFAWQGKRWHLRVGFDRDGAVREIFMAGHEATDIKTKFDNFCIVTSVALQSGNRLEELIHSSSSTPNPEPIEHPLTDDQGDIDPGTGRARRTLEVATLVVARWVEREHGAEMAAEYARTAVPVPPVKRKRRTSTSGKRRTAP